jgi:type III secretion protein L
MPLFTLIKDEEIHLPPKTKVIAAEDYSQLIDASAIVAKTKEQEKEYRIEVAKECENLKELAEAAGFEEGLKRWNEQLALLEKEIKNVRKEMENSIVPLALTAVKKILGKELESAPQTIVDIVATALKTVSHHRRITIYVNQNDLEYVEAQRPRLKALFEHLETLSIAARNTIEMGGCIIETESGIINAQLENQFLALESAFRNFFETKKKKGKA